MRKFIPKILIGIGVLLVLITAWNLSVRFLIPPHSFTFTDSAGQLTRTETRQYLFRIAEVRMYVEDEYLNKSISFSFGKTAVVSTYDADGKLMDRETVDLT